MCVFDQCCRDMLYYTILCVQKPKKTKQNVRARKGVTATAPTSSGPVVVYKSTLYAINVVNNIFMSLYIESSH